MDGQHTVKELVIAYYQRHRVLALARVASLVGLLRTEQFLKQHAQDVYAELAQRLHGKQRPTLSPELSTRCVDVMSLSSKESACPGSLSVAAWRLMPSVSPLRHTAQPQPQTDAAGVDG